jgi:anaerobic magnesium-protoporphyrin IX monomethyl ester cyclase
MKILLINPLYQESLGGKYERYFIRSGSRWPHSGVKLKEERPHYLPFPFTLAYAAAYLKSLALEIEVIDAVALNMPQDQLLRQILNINPQIVFYEFTTLTVAQDLSLAQKIKELTKAIIIAAGTHCTYFAGEIIQKYKFIDFIIRGDDEYLLGNLVQNLKNGDSPKLPGVVYLVEGAVVDNGQPDEKSRFRNLITPLRDIFPSRERPDPTVYWDGFCQMRPTLQLQSSRGCKYRCSFCLNAVQPGGIRQYRVASCGEVCDEIEAAIQKYRIREFYFDDDDFTQDLEHVGRIFQALKERKRRIKWSAMASFANLSPQVIKRLAGYGCIGLKLGVESASEKVLKSVHKSVDLKSVAGIIASCRRCGIKTHLTFSIGFLGETLDDIKQTFIYAQSLDADSIQVSIATPLPGTEFFEMAKARSQLGDFTWKNYDAKRSSVIISPDFDTKILGKLRRDFLRRWFIRKILSPAWLIGHLPVMLRTLAGWGPALFCKQLKAIFLDESKNS